MRKLAMLAAATLAATALSATPASAQVVYTDCGPGTCFPGITDNINIDTGTSGHIGSTLFSFSSSTDTLAAQGSGQATLTSLDGLINQVTFAIQPGFYFQLAELNLQDQFSNATTVTLTSSGGGSQTYTIDGNGANRFGIDFRPLGQLVSVSLSSTLGFGTLEQIRVGQIFPVGTPQSAVPEPATWAMMLFGFGATGVALRRSRRRKGLLTQFA